MLVCEELRPAVGGEGTLVALLVPRRPVVQGGAAAGGQGVTAGSQGEGGGARQKASRIASLYLA